jgi:hypothetical protein
MQNRNMDALDSPDKPFARSARRFSILRHPIHPCSWISVPTMSRWALPMNVAAA